jgi:hypothetical protein
MTVVYVFGGIFGTLGGAAGLWLGLRLVPSSPAPVASTILITALAATFGAFLGVGAAVAFMALMGYLGRSQ